MKRIIKFAMRISLAVGLLLGAGWANAELVVIVNANNPLDEISAKEVGRIYLGKARAFPNGAWVNPIDQARGSAARKDFYHTYTGMSEAQAKAHWARLMFSGKGQAPTQLNGGDAAVKAAVVSDPRAMGYIDAAAVDSSVKSLRVTP